MPTVLRFDDPALVATLAGQAGRYAVNDDQRREALAVAGIVSQNLASRATMPPPAQPSAPSAPPTPAWTEVLPNGEMGAPGARIYHPAGGNPPGDGGGHFPNTAAGGVLSGGGYVHPNQAILLQTADQMGQEGMLSPEEHLRYRALILTGQNPFTQPTESQRQRLRQEQFSDQDKANLGIKLQQETDRQGDRAFQQKLSVLRERLDVKTRLLQTATGDDRKRLQSQINTLEEELANLASAPAATGDLSAGPQTDVLKLLEALGLKAPMANGQAGAMPAPLTQADVEYLVRKYGGAAKAREAAATGERASAVAPAAPDPSVP